MLKDKSASFNAFFTRKCIVIPEKGIFCQATIIFPVLKELIYHFQLKLLDFLGAPLSLFLSMAKQIVKLKDIIDSFEMISEESHSYLNKKTGEIIIITDEEFNAVEDDEPLDEYPEWQIESILKAKDIIKSESDYISLPHKFDIHEWDIMKRFCNTIKNPSLQNELFDAIHGRGAFRMFRNVIHRNGIENKWYAFREDNLRQIAIDWCEVNNILYSIEK